MNLYTYEIIYIKKHNESLSILKLHFFLFGVLFISLRNVTKKKRKTLRRFKPLLLVGEKNNSHKEINNIFKR